MNDDTLIHRIGSTDIANFLLKPHERSIVPPGISVLIGGTAEEASETMKNAFPPKFELHRAAARVSSATLGAIRSTGFNVIECGSKRLPNHGRIVHSLGFAAFNETALGELASMFSIWEASS